jgi:cystathionine beta-synthase
MASTPIQSAETSTDEMQYYDNILGTLGNTPLVRLHTVTRGLKPKVLAKVEFFNPGGSVKDRIGLAIIEV